MRTSLNRNDGLSMFYVYLLFDIRINILRVGEEKNLHLSIVEVSGGIGRVKVVI